MSNSVFSNISKIIERDSKATTYKFALLRGVIDIIQDQSPYIRIYGNKVHIPTGLLIEKWLIYYYPILESKLVIPQSHGKKNLSFSIQFQKLIKAYANKVRNGCTGFYLDLKRNGIPNDLYEDFISLSRKIYKTITEMPMKHIGFSITHEHYSIFSFTPGYTRIRPYILDVSYLIKNFGEFTIPLEYYQSFQLLGSFINGQDSLLFKWAEFSVNASKGRLSQEEVIDRTIRGPLTEREIESSKKIFKDELKKQGKLICIWTGSPIIKYDIDHLIPFSVWKNNDLWNLLPTKNIINNKKRDKIPTPETIEKHKDKIFYYWDLLDHAEPIKFQKELHNSLIGDPGTKSWKETALNQLERNCDYLITERGFEPWAW
jgi:hypothetical protein